jgi:hypothetical protein
MDANVSFYEGPIAIAVAVVKRLPSSMMGVDSPNSLGAARLKSFRSQFAAQIHHRDLGRGPVASFLSF